MRARRKKPQELPRHMTPGYISYRLHWVPSLDLAYLANPKAASSTIKKTLWLACSPATFAGDPHSTVGSPFVGRLNSDDELDRLRQSFFFSVVRNPYARILSAYLDKIGTPERDRNVWDLFARRFDLDPESYPSFLEFLSLLGRESPELLDAHFRPQSYNLLEHLLWPDFVGHVEEIGELFALLQSKGLEPAIVQGHKTEAASRLSDWFGPNEIQAAQQLYERDFELYGYSLDPRALGPIWRKKTEARRLDLDRVLRRGIRRPKRSTMWLKTIRGLLARR